MKKIVAAKILGLAGLMFLLPAIGSASTISWSLTGFTSGSTVGSSASVGSATLSFSGIDIAGNNLTDTITETYSFTAGVGTLKFSSGSTVGQYGFVAGQTFLTITENGSNLLPALSDSVNLYQNVTSIVFNDASFALALGHGTTSFTTPAAITALINTNPSGPSFSLTSSNSGSVVSAIGAMTVNTPEPSTFAMLGIALFAGLGISLRKKLALDRLSR